ncbi:MAG: DUF4279 domain-containing protein [Gammaproteobacteria bacterium]
MSDYRFCVSLQISHPTLDLEDLTQVLELKPFKVWKLGEPRFTPKGTPLEGAYKCNVWSAKMHEQERIFSADIYLEDYLEKLNQQLQLHKKKFGEIVNSGGYIEYFIGWFSEGNISTTLSPQLLRSTAELSISIGFDIYAYED